jgi:hypothetical protein
MPLIGSNYPANSRIFNNYLIAVAAFDLLPTDTVYPEIFAFNLAED